MKTGNESVPPPPRDWKISVGFAWQQAWLGFLGAGKDPKTTMQFAARACSAGLGATWGWWKNWHASYTRSGVSGSRSTSMSAMLEMLGGEAGDNRVLTTPDCYNSCDLDMAIYKRNVRNPQRIAITGSIGKTTTKHLTCEVIIKSQDLRLLKKKKKRKNQKNISCNHGNVPNLLAVRDPNLASESPTLVPPQGQVQAAPGAQVPGLGGKASARLRTGAPVERRGVSSRWVPGLVGGGTGLSVFGSPATSL